MFLHIYNKILKHVILNLILTNNMKSNVISTKITAKMRWQRWLGLHIIALYLFTKIKMKMIINNKRYLFSFTSTDIKGIGCHLEHLPWWLLFTLQSLHLTSVSKSNFLYILKWFCIITSYHKPYTSFKFLKCNIVGYLFTLISRMRLPRFVFGSSFCVLNITTLLFFSS